MRVSLKLTFEWTAFGVRSLPRLPAHTSFHDSRSTAAHRSSDGPSLNSEMHLWESRLAGFSQPRVMWPYSQSSWQQRVARFQRTFNSQFEIAVVRPWVPALVCTSRTAPPSLGQKGWKFQSLVCRTQATRHFFRSTSPRMNVNSHMQANLAGKRTA